jgi:Arc/MetJ family transcription regulator
MLSRAVATYDVYTLQRHVDILILVRKTSIEVDDDLVARAAAVLGTHGLKATVQRALEEIVALDARMRLAERLQHMAGLDLDKPEVMDQAWR